MVKVCLFGKYPPIQGGVSAQTYWSAKELAERDHEVHIVTNASEVEYGYRQLLLSPEKNMLSLNDKNGKIVVHSTSPLRRRSYIPWARPYVTELFGLGMKVLKKHRCDLIIGWYFEPYGFVSYLVGSMTGMPFVLRHAGSDISRLIHHLDLKESYLQMLQHAHAVIATEEIRTLLKSLGVDMGKSRFVTPKISRLPALFFEKENKLDLQEYRSFAKEWFTKYPVSESIRGQLIASGERKLNPSALTIGTYGKIGKTKGSFALISTLGQLAKIGILFNFLCIPCGSGFILEQFMKAIEAERELLDQTTILPPLPPWRIPGFLQLCDAVCFLEHEFPIAIHTPRIPREVLASGKTLICSSEIIAKQGFHKNCVDGKNMLIIPDPNNIRLLTASIERLLRDPDECGTIGKHGQYLSSFWEDLLPENTFADLIENIGL